MDWKKFFRPRLGPTTVSPGAVETLQASDSAPKLEASLKTQLAPLLRQDGFKGSGSRFRRIANGMVQIIEIQRRSGGGAFAINLGIHHEALIDVETGKSLSKIKEYDCLLRWRLTDNVEGEWWSFGPSQASMDAAVRDAAVLYLKTGRVVLDSEMGPSAKLLTLTPEEFRGRPNMSGFNNTDFCLAEGLAHIRKWAGNDLEAKAFADIARELTKSETIRRQLIAEFG
jgi:hypothetical protein